MPPRHQTLPPAQTSSAREALKSFYCALCSKGYSRMNEYESHLSSYDHSHKQRLKDMKAMVRDPNAGARARKAEAKAEGLVSIKLPGQESSSSVGTGFKKGGFKKSGFKDASGSGSLPVSDKPAAAAGQVPSSKTGRARSPPPKDSLVESETEDEDYELYDPRFPTE